MRVELTYGLFRGPWACRPMHTEKEGPGDVDWINQIIRPIFMAWVTEKNGWFFRFLGPVKTTQCRWGPVQTPLHSCAEPTVTDELSTAEERRLNQFGSAD